MGKQNNKKKKGGKKKAKKPLARHDENAATPPSPETYSDPVDTFIKAFNRQKELSDICDSHLTSGAIAAMMQTPEDEEIVLRPRDPPIYLQMLGSPTSIGRNIYAVWSSERVLTKFLVIAKHSPLIFDVHLGKRV